MNSRLLTIWEASGEEAEVYRARWLAQAKDPALAVALGNGKFATKVVGNANLHTCPHLWKRVRGTDGNVLKRSCKSCRGTRELDLFECRCPERQKDGRNDQVTLEDCKTCEFRPMPQEMAEIPVQTPVKVQPRKLIFHLHLSPGDVLCLTAAVYSLHKQHPGRFVTGVDTSCPHLWENNPNVARKEELEGAETVAVRNMLINHCNQRAVHVMQDYCDFLAHALQVPVPLMTNRPLVYVSDEEKGWMDQVQQETGRKQKFWLVNAGVKSDYTNKGWGQENFQRVVDILRGRVLFVQVGSVEHRHKPLRNVINFLGKTDQRQLVRLMYHADGALTGVSFLHHLAAALQKPSVTLLGGREPATWNTYPRATLLHTGGALPGCCKELSIELGWPCWKSRVVRLGDGQEQDNSLCVNPVHGEEPIPKCLAVFRPEEVAENILRNTILL